MMIIMSMRKKYQMADLSVNDSLNDTEEEYEECREFVIKETTCKVLLYYKEDSELAIIKQLVSWIS